MKILSLKQPWACLVVYFGKHLENRRWSTRFRGEFLIHASKGMTRREFDEALEFSRPILGDSCPTEERLREMLRFGGIVGHARLVSVIAPCNPIARMMVRPGPGKDASLCICRAGEPWHMGDQFGFVLTDVVPLPFRPCKGRLGFFELAKEAA